MEFNEVFEINNEFDIGKTITGGFASIYIVRHRELGYLRAFKTLQVSINNANSDIRQKAHQDFKEECKRLMQLGNGINPNIVNIYKCEIENEPYYVEMEYVDGKVLHDYSLQTFLSINEVYKFIEDIGGALAYCHNYTNKSGIQKGVIHNDLHSGNIIRRNADGAYILLDFGLSMEDGEIIRSSKTKTGWCEFMPPERCEMEFNSELKYEALPAWDVYSFGCLIYMALTGQAPFPKKEGTRIYTDYEVLNFHMDVDKHKPWGKINERRRNHFCSLPQDRKPKNYEDKNNPQDCPDWLIRMIEKCMARNAENRYKDAQEFMEEYKKIKYENSVPYEEYAKVLAEKDEIKRDRNELQERFTELEAEEKKVFCVPLKRNWILAVVVVIVLACNCIPYMGDADKGNVSIGATWIVISILTSLVVIGVAIYDTVISKSNK